MLVRFHNASDTAYTSLEADPSGRGQNLLPFGMLEPGAYSGYIEVPEARVYPVIDVSCFYAHYTFTPGTATPVIENDPGHYTYHVDLVAGETGNELTVTQSAD